ncbi:MAG: sulfatase, partial [Bacteroidales bacterium]|nr:sulfatase [Bacteroidales bacterium]
MRKTNSNLKYFLLLCFIIIGIDSWSQPNIVLILADDQGYNQLGCYGSSYYETPNLDALADSGMKFTDAYASSAVCSPTRGSILTGKYPARLHLTDWLNGWPAKPEQTLMMPVWNKRLAGDEVTIAEKLKENGYVTGFWGKWHLGNNESKPDPQGFDTAMEYSNAKTSNYDGTCLQNSVLQNSCWDDPHSTLKIAKKANEFIEANAAKPMFLYVSYNAVHDPIIDRHDLVTKYQNKAGADKDENNPILAAMIETLDSSVGLIYNKFKELDLLDSTVFIYFSDNGFPVGKAPVHPLKGGKAQYHEGGIREPLIVSWPGKIAKGSVSNDYVICNDFYTTILDLAGINYDSVDYPDSRSFVKSLEGEQMDSTRPVFWHYPHYHVSNPYGPQGAVRQGKYKLIVSYEE